MAKAILDQLLRIAESEQDTTAGRAITVSSANPEWYKLLKTQWNIRKEPPSLTDSELGLYTETNKWLDFILHD
ncbi:unnamed protein product [Fusarium graminearum]|uniref:Uncharacterized protein n=1 Tax=Gibberella zeae TaxID=5518 RepID=A0A9N8RAA3_GIBZA|nr:unnamed protein product [Fusarium graminearum]